ncbi:amino acid permease 3-like [Cucumis melo var. makuwa]|uniref:DNA primase n=1 Tax=Cucumis melo var. makuwa TaxID=1194695 RepID=A0A5A7SUG1_CUCMM|nr:amino acid permease 3-like [Cucumis melo var. makuwa]
MSGRWGLTHDLEGEIQIKSGNPGVRTHDVEVSWHAKNDKRRREFLDSFHWSFPMFNFILDDFCGGLLVLGQVAAATTTIVPRAQPVPATTVVTPHVLQTLLCLPPLSGILFFNHVHVQPSPPPSPSAFISQAPIWLACGQICCRRTPLCCSSAVDGGAQPSASSFRLKRRKMAADDDLEDTATSPPHPSIVSKAQGMRRYVEEIVFSFTYPRLNLEVTKHMNHLLKAPFCVHPKTGRICVPIDPEHCDEFDPTTVPTVAQLLEELNAADMEVDSETANGKIGGSLTGISIGTVTQTQKVWRSFQALGDIAFAYSYSIILIEIQDTLKSPPSEAKTMKKATLVSVSVTTLFYMLCGAAGYAPFGHMAPGNLLTGFGFYI